MFSSLNIHDVTSVKSVLKRKGSIRWTEIKIVAGGKEIEVILFPEDMGADLPMDEDLSQVRELGPQTKYSS